METQSDNQFLALVKKVKEAKTIIFSSAHQQLWLDNKTCIHIDKSPEFHICSKEEDGIFVNLTEDQAARFMDIWKAEFINRL